MFSFFSKFFSSLFSILYKTTMSVIWSPPPVEQITFTGCDSLPTEGKYLFPLKIILNATNVRQFWRRFCITLMP